MAKRKFGLISDTHGHIHPDIAKHFAGVEGILHAGDVCGDDVYATLDGIAPLSAVAGNCDRVTKELPLRRTVELPFGQAGIAHGHLYASSIRERLHDLVRAFQGPRMRLILTGHSHQALMETVDGILIVNPGAASPPRMGADSSLAVLTWDDVADSLDVKMIPLKKWK